jgi:phage head maturation protease
MKKPNFDWRRLASQKRSARVLGQPSSYDKKSRSVEAVISVGSAVQRFYGIEKLRVSTEAVILDRMKSSGIPLLDSHQQYGIDNVLGQFERIWIGRADGVPAVIGRIRFADTERGRQAEGMVARGEIKGISAGYQVYEWEITDKDGRVLDPETDAIRIEDDLTFTATRWEIHEASLVSVPADAPAMVRSSGSADAVSTIYGRMQARQKMIEQQAELHQIDHNHPITKQTDDGGDERAIENDQENNMNFRVIRDERQGIADAMQIALTQTILGTRGRSALEYQGETPQEQRRVAKHREQARQYMGRSLVELAAIASGYRAPRGTFINATTAQQIFERAFNTTGDFPSIFANALNKALLARYVLMAPTYREIAAERSFVDFRPHPQVRAGDFPTLQPVLQTGELEYRATTDNNEPISINPYGIIFGISRQMLVNDDLGAIDQILGSAGDMVLAFENTTFFKMFSSNPTLNQDNTPVFATAHGNLAASGAVPSVTALGAGREALRQMKSISGNFINVPPSIILTGPAQETTADQMVASITPTLTTSVNPFSARLRSVSDANIADDSWYLAADPARVPCFIYGFLAGSGGPRTRIYEPFGVQGVKVSLEHDFGCGAIDYRGFYKNSGQ